MARAEVPRGSRRLPGEHPHRGAQLLQGGPARRLQENTPEVPKSGLYKLVYCGRGSGRSAAGRWRPSWPTTTSAPARRTSSSCRRRRAWRPWRTRRSSPRPGRASSELDSYLNVPNLKDLHALFEGPQYMKYNAFRDTEDARYTWASPAALPSSSCPTARARCRCAPSNYEEDVVGRSTRPTSAEQPHTFAFGTRLAESFARYRWLPNIVGPASGGTVDGLVLH